jgi:hypothetical protein
LRACCAAPTDSEPSLETPRSPLSSQTYGLWCAAAVPVGGRSHSCAAPADTARDRGEMLARRCRRNQAARRAHVEAVADHGDVVVGLLDGVHLAAAHILAGNGARLVLEGDAVVVALRDEVGILLARGVEEVELLAPVALALRLGAVVARRLGLVALEMALPAR